MIKEKQNKNIRKRRLSGRALRELIVIAIILCISIALSIPGLLRDIDEKKKIESNKKGNESFLSIPEKEDANICDE